jgi:hypothetical protein
MTDGVAFGFLSTGLIGAAYYIVPMLTGTEIENLKSARIRVIRGIRVPFVL